jgi:hypothetical protein
MNAHVSIPAAVTAAPVPRAHADRPYALWALALVLVAIGCTVLVLDASITPAQRIELLTQSGMFP